MNGDTHSSIVERAGVWLGRACRRVMRGERQVGHWLVDKGVPIPAANASIWIGRLTFLAVVLYFSVLLAAIVVVVLIVATFASHPRASSGEDSPQPRNGLLGFGLYDRDGHRIDPHDPDDQQ